MAVIWLFIKGIGAKIWAGVLLVGAVLLAIAAIFGAGKKAARTEVAENNAEIKDAQLEVVRPNTDAELDDKLRNGKF